MGMCVFLYLRPENCDDLIQKGNQNRNLDCLRRGFSNPASYINLFFTLNLQVLIEYGFVPRFHFCN